MRIIFTVTNELHFDQRMIRICDSLKDTGFDVELVGVRFASSHPLRTRSFHQKRIKLLFKKGFGFYAEYNIRLFFYLLFQKFDIVCCVDLDTMLPAYFISVLRKKKRVYDAHEYFSELKEIVQRPRVYRVWHFIERTFLPKFKNGYTVSKSIAEEFGKLYGVQYDVIRNIPMLNDLKIFPKNEKIIIYQGSVNEARGFEFLIPAMRSVNAQLHIYGAGNFSKQTEELIKNNGVSSKVFLKGKVVPSSLKEITSKAYIGINLVENTGLNQYYSLANKFFDYIHHGLPQVTMDFPEYRKINNQYEVAILIDQLSIKKVSDSIIEILDNETFYTELQQNCLKAREEFTWQKEEIKLYGFYKNLILGNT